MTDPQDQDNQNPAGGNPPNPPAQPNQPAPPNMAAGANPLDLATAWIRMSQPFFRLWDTNPLTGKSDQDVVKWFDQFEYLSALVQNLSNEDKLAELKKSVQGRAQDVMQGATAAEIASYDVAKTLLIERLSQPHQLALYRQQFATRVKKPDETVADFISDLRKLVKQANPGASSESLKLVLKERFIGGLGVSDKGHPNYKLWKSAYANLAKSLDEIIVAVSTAEMTQKMFSLTASPVVINPTASDVTNTLLAMYGSQQVRESSNHGARLSRNRQGGGNGYQQRPHNRSGQQRSVGPCEYDGFPHPTNECRLLPKAQERFEQDPLYACRYCGLTNHSTSDCFKLVGARHRLNAEPIMADQQPVSTFSNHGYRQARSDTSGGNTRSPQTYGTASHRAQTSYPVPHGAVVQSQDDQVFEYGNLFSEPYVDHGFCSLPSYEFSSMEPYVEHNTSRWAPAVQVDTAALPLALPLLNQPPAAVQAAAIQLAMSPSFTDADLQQIAPHVPQEAPPSVSVMPTVVQPIAPQAQESPPMSIAPPKSSLANICDHDQVRSPNISRQNPVDAGRGAQQFSLYQRGGQKHGKVPRSRMKSKEPSSWAMIADDFLVKMQMMLFSVPLFISAYGPVLATSRISMIFSLCMLMRTVMRQLIFPPHTTEHDTMAEECDKHLASPAFPFTKFLGHTRTQVFQLCNRQKNTAMSLHPNCKGLTQQFHKMLTTLLSIAKGQFGIDWVLALPFIIFAYRSSIQATIKFSPSKVLFGREPKIPGELSVQPIDRKSTKDYVDEVAAGLNAMKAIIRNNLLEAQERQKSHYDKDIHTVDFPVNSLVWLQAVPKGMGAKLQAKWEGPYIVLAKPSTVDSVIRSWSEPTASRKLVHNNRLKPCHAPWEMPPGMEEDDDDELLADDPKPEPRQPTPALPTITPPVQTPPSPPPTVQQPSAPITEPALGPSGLGSPGVSTDSNSPPSSSTPPSTPNVPPMQSGPASPPVSTPITPTIAPPSGPPSTPHRSMDDDNWMRGQGTRLRTNPARTKRFQAAD